MEHTELCVIMGECGSDKGHRDINRSWHNYTLLYHKLFNVNKNNKLRVFELGLGTNNVNLPSNMGINGKPGASLYGWAKFFPNASIFGADIDRDILFQTDRIKTYYCDQLNPSEIKEMWNNRDLWEPFDIIIEDGLHHFDANVCFFENSIFKLKRGGYYIIEDINRAFHQSWKNKIEEWKIIYPELSFQFVTLPSNTNRCDNTLLIVTFDLMNRIEFI
jgi:hypothetical protein